MAKKPTKRIQVRGSLSPDAARELAALLLRVEWTEPTAKELARLFAVLYR